MRNVFTAYLILLSMACVGQKEDYIWLAGYESAGGFVDSAAHIGYGISKLDFNYNPRAVTYDSLGIDFSRTCITYSDTNGQILFYSNGISIHNKWDELIQNSDSLNAGWLIYNFDSTVVYGPAAGYRIPQEMVCVPIPDSNNQFLLIYSFTDSNLTSSNLIITDKTLLVYLDMNANNGHGMVLFKNQPIIEDTIVVQMTAVRHGNGRDWWVLAQKTNGNCFYRIMINPSGLTVLPDKTCVGVKSNPFDSGGSCFSPDGSKYAVVNYYTGISLYSFDRCVGTLSDSIYLPLPQLTDSQWLPGITFSPNSRFLYVCAINYCYQFDTWAADVWGSIDTVADRDTIGDHSIPAGYYTPQLAPDGKIYIANGSTLTNYHVIDSPDLKGGACGFIKHGLYTPTFQHDVPNFQNYRLGRLVGSGCDTLTSLLEVNSDRFDMRVYPNPAQDFFTVDYGLADWTRHESLGLKVTDITGQVLFTTTLSRYSALCRVSSASFAPGMYLVEITDSDGHELSVKKLVKEE